MEMIEDLFNIPGVWGPRGKQKDEGVFAANGKGWSAKGENVSSDNGSLRPLLGTSILCHIS